MLIVKPFLGETGWEFMRWQGHVRFCAKKHKTTQIYCRAEFEYLYKDITKWITPVKVIGGTPDLFRREGCVIIYPEGHPKSPYGEDEVLIPNKAVCAKLPIKQDFIKYGIDKPELRKENVIIIHARNTQHQYRNYPMDKWAQLVALIKKNCSPCTIFSIGSKEGASWITETIDFRGHPLENLCTLLASAIVCIGPSSGPMHLASLCCCPHIVFSDDKIWRVGNKKATNMARYTRIWNPFNVECTILDKNNWCPDPVDVLSHVVYYYNKNKN